MIKRSIYEKAKKDAATLIKNAGVVISKKEIDDMDIADFGLSDLYTEGAQILSLYDTEKITGRVIALFPYQTEPEHWHIAVNNLEGKEETIRIISGTLLMFVEGESNVLNGKIPEKNSQFYTCKKEIVMKPCDVLTLKAGEKHWFQAADKPVVFYTMSTVAKDAYDPFTNPNIVRKTVIIENI